MLAPRKTLWSTPGPVLDHVMATTPLRPTDTVCDIGCGDGRCLIQWAQDYTAKKKKMKREETEHASSAVDDGTTIQRPQQHWPSFLGIDIDSDRIQQAQRALDHALANKSIHSDISIKFICANALQDPTFFATTPTTILFVYLIPRGLKLLQPHLGQMPHLRTVISYMAPIPEWNITRMDKIPVQPGTAWPVYVYELEEEPTTEEKEDEGQPARST